MDVQEFAEQYRQKSDEELLRLAAEQEQLSNEARIAFQGELSSRGISTEDVDRYRAEGEHLRLKEERRKELDGFRETGNRVSYGKTNVEYDPETGRAIHNYIVLSSWICPSDSDRDLSRQEEAIVLVIA